MGRLGGAGSGADKATLCPPGCGLAVNHPCSPGPDIERSLEPLHPARFSILATDPTGVAAGTTTGYVEQGGMRYPEHGAILSPRIG